MSKKRGVGGAAPMPETFTWRSSVGSWDFKLFGFYVNNNEEANSLTVRRGSEVSEV